MADVGPPLRDGALDLHADARAAFEAFETWADRAGVSLAPFFDRRERSTLADPAEATPERLLPVVALTVHDGERVVAAYPHTDDGDPRGVDEALALLGSDRGSGVAVEAGETRQGVAD